MRESTNQQVRCGRCGRKYFGADDGWDGLCPTCADQAEDNGLPGFEEFEAKYVPVEWGRTECGNPALLETYGDELDRVKKTPVKHIWTVVDGDGGSMVVCAGFHVVNRVNYIITEQPWETGAEAFNY